MEKRKRKDEIGKRNKAKEKTKEEGKKGKEGRR